MRRRRSRRCATTARSPTRRPRRNASRRVAASARSCGSAPSTAPTPGRRTISSAMCGAAWRRCPASRRPTSRRFPTTMPPPRSWRRPRPGPAPTMWWTTSRCAIGNISTCWRRGWASHRRGCRRPGSPSCSALPARCSRARSACRTASCATNAAGRHATAACAKASPRVLAQPGRAVPVTADEGSSLSHR